MLLSFAYYNYLGSISRRPAPLITVHLGSLQGWHLLFSSHEHSDHQQHYTNIIHLKSFLKILLTLSWHSLSMCNTVSTLYLCYQPIWSSFSKHFSRHLTPIYTQHSVTLYSRHCPNAEEGIKPRRKLKKTSPQVMYLILLVFRCLLSSLSCLY